MFLFLRLILAHLIGDFILQFEELYRLKVRSQWGHFFHALIHALVSLILAAPYLSIWWMGPYLVGLAIIHHFQDTIKYGLQAKHPKWIFWCFTIDQIVHLAFMATVLLIPAAWEVRGFPNTPILDLVYTDNLPILIFVAAVATTFKGTYQLHAFRKSFIPGSRPDHFITSFESWHSLIERTWITFWIIFAPAWIAFPAGILIGSARFFFPSLKNGLDFGLSYTWAAIVGLIFKCLIGKFA